MLSIYAAGSLRYAFTELLAQFETNYGIATQVTLGPAGLLAQRIEQGDSVDLFASANLQHPQRLVEKGFALSSQHFIDNTLCIVMRNVPELTQQNWLSALADERFILATSTPNSDPSGDYTVQLFEQIEMYHQGIGFRLLQRAKHLVGGAVQSNLPVNTFPAAYFIDKGEADIFIGYRNNVAQLSAYDYLHIVDIPAPYTIDVHYGLCVLKAAQKDTQLLADFILSQTGQQSLTKWGFLTFKDV